MQEKQAYFVRSRRSDNPFWHEMARRRWLPSRARLHFGDAPPPRPPWKEDGSDKLERTIDDVVWTAMRDSALHVALADGRSLQIGGEILDYGDEYADPWNYNDIIVTRTDGAIEILTYPLQVFPHLYWWGVDAVIGEEIYIFGIIDRQRHPARSRGPAVLRLDTSTYAITPIPVPDPPVPIHVYQGSGVRDGNRVVFPAQTYSKADPRMAVAFDLATLTWGEPFPLSHPVDD